MSSPFRWADVGVSVYPRLVFVFFCSSLWLRKCSLRSGSTSDYVLSGPSGLLNESWYRTWTCLIKSRCSQFDQVFARHRISVTSKADSNGRVFRASESIPYYTCFHHDTLIAILQLVIHKYTLPFAFPMSPQLNVLLSTQQQLPTYLFRSINPNCPPA